MPRKGEASAQLFVALADTRRLGDLTADRRKQLVVGQRALRPWPPARRYDRSILRL